VAQRLTAVAIAAPLHHVRLRTRRLLR